MRRSMPWQAPLHGDRESSQRIAVRRHSLFAAAFAAACLAFSPSGSAQTSGPIGQTQPAVHVQPATPSQPLPMANAAAPPAAASPSGPGRPDWPVNAQAVKAKVEWNSRGLHIVAENSSLKQILEDISAATGAKLDGLGEDERVFGAYGPGSAREVISQLLDGTEYNVLMSGDQGQGTPREIVLSRRPAGSGQSSPIGSQNAAHIPGQNAASMASQNAAEEDAAPEEPQPVEQTQAEPQPSPQPAQQQQQQQQQQQPQTPTPPRSGFGSGAPRTPQQIIQEMQERQQQSQQQQEQQNNSQ